MKMEDMVVCVNCGQLISLEEAIKIANGVYFLGLTKYHAFDKAATMSHFRCKEIEIPELLYHAKVGDLQEFLQKKYYPRWKSQAEKCIQKYALMDEK